MKIDCSVRHDELECGAEVVVPQVGAKWRRALLVVMAVSCVAVGAGCPREKPKAVAAATDENKAAARTGDGQSAEEATLSAEEGDYTYEYYEGDSVPYYRGYYYRGGSWVWGGSGVATFPPPQFRPVLRSGTAKPKAVRGSSTPVKAVSSKPVASKPVRVKRTPAKSVRHGGGGKASAPKGPRR